MAAYASRPSAMCFSATGSFGVGAVIAAVGVVATAQDKPRTHRLLAYSYAEPTNRIVLALHVPFYVLATWCRSSCPASTRPS
jgi:hypothetical protein